MVGERGSVMLQRRHNSQSFRGLACGSSGLHFCPSETGRNIRETMTMTKIRKTIEAKRVLGIGYLHSTGSAVVFEGITAEQVAVLNRAVGNRLCTHGNPTGVSFYYDLDQKKPFRIADDQYNESFATYEELLAACESWESWTVADY